MGALSFKNCFQNLNIDLSIRSGNYIFIKHATIKNSYRIFTTYSEAQKGSFKQDLGKLLNQTFEGSWQWHHVFEGTHLELLFNQETKKEIYQNIIPCVLINYRTEHYDYNSLLHSAGAKAVFNLPKKGDVLKGAQRIEYLKNLHNLYSKVYGRDTILNTVTNNFFKQLQ